MTLPKPTSLLATALVLLCPLAKSSAATIALTGRIQGRTNADWTEGSNNNIYTLHFYWFTVTAPTTITYTWCMTNGPGGNWGTAIDSHIRPNASEVGDLGVIGAVGGTVLGENPPGTFCSQLTYDLQPGRYLFDVVAGAGGYDGLDGLRPLDQTSKDFLHFDYNALVEGEDIRLDEIWQGQADATWLKTVVPEPGVAALCAASLWLLVRQRDRLRRGVLTSVAIGCCFAASAPAEQSVSDFTELNQGWVKWQSLPSKGYKLQRVNPLQDEPWLTLPCIQERLASQRSRRWKRPTKQTPLEQSPRPTDLWV